MAPDPFFLATVATLGVSTTTTIPAVVAHIARARKTKTETPPVYQDEDGEATIESTAQFSTRWQKAHILLWAAAGLGCQIAFSVILETSPHRNHRFSLQSWLTTASWGLIGMQAISIAATRDSVRAYNQGTYLAVTGLAVGSLLLAQLNNAPTWYSETGRTSLILCIASIATAVGLIIASLSLPRRPDVYSKGKLVDRMFTVSAFNRLTYSWATTLMLLATKKGDLDMEDIPRLNHGLRPSFHSEQWSKKKKGTLFRSILRLYGWGFFKQWTAASASAAISYLPWWVTLRLLEALEARRPGEPMAGRLWLYLLWLGLAKVAGSLLDSWLMWTQIIDLDVPVRSQLSAVIFEKATRRKNVKSADASKDDEKLPAEQAATDGQDKSNGATDDTTSLKTKQAVINLMSVDAVRVADFSFFQFMFPTSIIRFTLSVWFLLHLLGWLPLTVGLLSVGLTIPLNTTMTKVLFEADERLMKIRDQKVELITEALNGVRQIKFSALEEQWEKRILGLREKELEIMWLFFKYNIVLDGCWTLIPILLGLTCLGTYAWIHGELTASVAFVSIGILATLDSAIASTPGLIHFAVEAWVSLKRIEKYLDGPEIKPIRTHTDKPDITFEDADLSWPVDDDEKTDETDKFVLRNVTLSFPSGELSVISGKTGSGKSLMLAAILGEADLLSGSIYVPAPPTLDERQDHKANAGNWVLPSSIAYVGQQPWIENATVRDNVLFGMPFDEERYEQTLAACALKKDLDALPDGDKTELGVNGVNLSGGQKWRITVARAVYSRAGILVMDDIFSAVDAHVSRHILEECLAGSLCKGRTVILVTHHVALVEKHARFIVDLADGGVRYYGLTEQLGGKVLERIKSFDLPEPEGIETDIDAEEADPEPLKRQNSKVGAKFVEDETRQKGAVKAHVYKTYIKSSGGWVFWVLMVLMYVGFQASEIAQPWVVRLWTGQSEAASLPIMVDQNLAPNRYHYYDLHNTSGPTLGVQEGRGVKFWLTIYAIVCLIGVFFGTVRFTATFYASLKASRTLFEKMLFSVLRTPLRWADTVPVGRILNRFSADFNSVDSDLANNGTWFLANWLQTLGICVTSFFVSPLIVPLAVLCLGWCLWLAKIYLAAARPAKRLHSTSKSPVLDLFGCTLTGLTTIRAFGRAGSYIDAMHTKIEENSTCAMNLYLFNRWIGWNMNLAGIAFTVIVVIFVLIQDNMDAALAGFVLNFAMQFSGAVLVAVRQSASLELEMNAVERVIEYSELETEDFGGEKAPAAWPTQGRLEVNDLVVGYAPQLPPVLKGITFHVNPAERIGVVGRTGAGKSSLTLALFRFLEPRSGSIHVDGLDIAKISLTDLRSRLAIIPQDPVLFSGTVRSNLDPFDNYTDEELHDSLRRVHLVPDTETSSGDATPSSSSEAETETAATAVAKNKNIFRDLSSPISEGGQNLSQGQRQLLCLARAIVSRPKVMVLDEATSAVDMATDTLIQRSIREEFGGSTLVVIAHRLSTIADFDRILVLRDGEVVEFGTPKELWEAEGGGVFRSMCNESGERDKLKSVILGEGSSKW
ncbi:hypothetical protein OQA88_11606 [Cercophora sp. LCS_1]